MPVGTDKSLTVSPWDCCGLALCQNRILFKLKIYWFKFRKTLLCCFYNQIRGWGNFDLYFFFFLWHLIWVWEGTIFSKLVLRTKVSKQDDYHFLWITVHVKSWACYIMQKQLKWNKQKYLFAYINFAKSSVGRKRGNTHKLTTAKHAPQVNLVQYFFKEENKTRLQDYGQESKANSQSESVYGWASLTRGKHTQVCLCPRAFPPAVPLIWNILLPDTCKTQPLTWSRSLLNSLKEVFPGRPTEHENLITTVYIFTSFAFLVVFVITGHLLVTFFFLTGLASHKNITSMSSGTLSASSALYLRFLVECLGWRSHPIVCQMLRREPDEHLLESL